LQAVLLYLLAALIGAAALLAVGQALTRQSFLESLDYPILRALGMTRRDLWALGMIRTVVIAAGGAGLAIAIAVLVSPLWPLGLARVAEPSLGLEVNTVVVAAGGMILALLVLVAGAIPAWRAARASDPLRTRAAAGRPSAAARFVQRASLPLPAVLGARQALERGRGPTAVPARTTALMAALAVATLVTAATFGASLSHLLDTPRLYGWAWDTQLGGEGLPDIGGPIAEGLSENSSVSSFAVGTVTELEVNGVRVAAFAVDTTRGNLSPALLEGRGPRGLDEIVLGTRTLDVARAHVGKRVSVRIGDRVRVFRVVGRAVFPNIGDSGQLGTGAFLTHAALRRDAPNAPRNVVLVRFATASDHAAVLAQLRRAVEPFPVTSASLPNDLVSFGRVDDLPLVVTVILALMAAAVLAHTLVTAIRRRQRDLAILKTLGFLRRQVAGTVAGQATTLALVGLLLGLPIGILAGRLAWTTFSDRQGIRAPAIVDVGVLALTIPLTILVANLIAAAPAYLAARTRPADALRAE
jgi:hypothetical protein